jgi:hypothetical protein
MLMQAMNQRRHWLVLNCVPGLLAFVSAAHGAVPPVKPATADEAARVLDLRRFPLCEGAETPQQWTTAGLTYQVKADVKAAFEFQQRELNSRKWEELPGSYVTDQAASATFAREAYKVSVSVFPTGMPEIVLVALTNHGNVDFAKLPVPEGVKVLYGGPVSLMYVTETAADVTAAACRKLLLAQGWRPYGMAGETQFFKQNGVRLGVTTSVAPAQGNKTVIDFQSALMSVDLPAPDDAIGLQYSESPTQIFFDSNASIAEIVEFYRSGLAKSDWKATTESPVKVDFRQEMIFRNKAEDMRTLVLDEVDGKTRVLLRHQSAAEVAELEALAKAEAERKKNAPATPATRIAVTLPDGAKDVQASKTEIEFKLASGQARPVVEGWRKQYAKDGWKEEAAEVMKEAGVVSLKKGELGLMIIYADPGFIPAEVTITASGAELERAVEKRNP